MVTIKELTLDNETALELLRMIKKEKPEIWIVLKEELNKALILPVVVKALKKTETIPSDKWIERKGNFTLNS